MPCINASCRSYRKSRPGQYAKLVFEAPDCIAARLSEVVYVIEATVEAQAPPIARIGLRTAPIVAVEATGVDRAIGAVQVSNSMEF